MNDSELPRQIAADIERLCSPGGRPPGTEANRAATGYVTSRMRELGLKVELLPFDVPEWRYGGAFIRVDEAEFPAHPGPFSPPAEISGPLLTARRWTDLDGLTASGSVLLLLDELASEPLTPRGYPFYTHPEHSALLDALETSGALAVVAATGRHPMAGALSPFPLIEESGIALPTAYLHEGAGTRLARFAGESSRIMIDSRTLPSSGSQPIGLLADGKAAGPVTVVVSAHVDSKPETPGALDNASGVATMLAVAALLRKRALPCAVEFVPFNGEDHALAPGEVAYLASRPDLSHVSLNVNIDGAGLRGSPSAYSVYGVDKCGVATLARLAASSGWMTEGPAWPASDHMVFAMRGVSAVAITSGDSDAVSGTYSHTSADVPDLVDTELLAETARFIAAVVSRWIEDRRPLS